MRVGIFTDTFYPEINGVATSCFNLQEELIKRGHEVHVYAPKCKGYKNNLRDDVHYITSIPLFVLKDRNMALSMFFDASEAKEMHFDIVHTNSEFFVGFLGAHVAKISNCPRIHTYHTIWEDYTYYLTHGIADEFAQKLARKYSEWWCQKSDRVVAPSLKTKELLESYKVTHSIDVIPTGINIKKFMNVSLNEEEKRRIREECGVYNDERILLYIGRLAKEKNIDMLIKAFPKLLDRIKNIKFVLIGEGNELDNLKDLTNNINMSDYINFVGPKKWDDIEKYYAIGDVFVSASHSETQGLTFVEAMASGLCVCAANDTCIEDVVIDGSTGFLFNDDEQSLIDALCKAFSDEGKQISKNTKEFVKMFSVETFAKEIEEVYQKTIRNFKK